MKDSKIALILFFGGLGLLAGYYYYSWEWEKMLPKIADGDKYLWLSIGVFFLSVVWQILGFIELFKKPEKSKAKKIFTSIFIGTGAILFLYLTIPLLIGLFGTGELGKWGISTHPMFFGGKAISEFTIPLFIGTLFYIVLLLALSTLFTGLLFCLLMLGRIGIGASVALTIHNWANSGSFDFYLILENTIFSIFESTLSDIWGFIIGTVWLLISNFILNR